MSRPDHHDRHRSRTAKPSDVSYLRLLRGPYAARLLFSTLVGRLPNAMAPVSLLLAARAEHGSLAFGGTLSAVYLVAFAVGQPVLGRIADRMGPTLPIVAGTITASSALGTLAFIGTGSPASSVLLAIVTGLSNPPLESSLRTLWPRVLPTHPEYLRAAYALNNGSQEAVYVTGPWRPRCLRPSPLGPRWRRPRSSDWSEACLLGCLDLLENFALSPWRRVTGSAH
ncbi:MFS transporter [Streptomyces sp. NPDC059816]|uniref:MFS transporter n=1 Tax=Streptomyces sp. NPDC059816 TaxID=3346960 RepID=UPI00365626B4